MESSVEELEGKARQLSVRERSRLVARLLASLELDPDGTPEQIAAAWDEEIARRLDAMDAGRVEWVDHQQLMAEVRSRVAAVRGK